MNCVITVVTKNTGDPNRGRHYKNTEVTFDYGDKLVRQDTEKEMELVSIMSNKKERTEDAPMAHWRLISVVSVGNVTKYNVDHGYNSGD